MAKRINIRPTTSVYATYKNIRYDPWTAIAEFVDNSTQSYYDNTEKLNSTKYWNGLAVDIEYKRDKVSGDHLIIKDNAYENAINKSNKGKSLVTLIFLSQSEVKKP